MPSNKEMNEAQRVLEALPPDVIPEGAIPNPLLAAAIIMRDVHNETVRLIDGGFTYTRDGEDVSLTMRAACVEELKRIEDMIASEPKYVAKAHTAVALYERFIAEQSQASAEATEKGQLS